MAVGGTAVIAALTAAGEGDHSRQQQRDGCPDDPWILEQSTHGGERAAGDQDWRGATQGRHQHRCRTQQHGISSWTLIH